MSWHTRIFTAYATVFVLTPGSASPTRPALNKACHLSENAESINEVHEVAAGFIGGRDEIRTAFPSYTAGGADGALPVPFAVARRGWQI